MLKTIDVYLITGFLGSGKTSCLNHIVKSVPSGFKAMILMNEFGSVGLDGLYLETSALNIVEVNKGSIFCACAKADFIRALAEIAVRHRPDVLFIEATGMANPKDIRKDLQLPFFKGAFKFAKQYCLVDVQNFVQACDQFNAPCYQLAAADVCILNKCDLSTALQVEEVRQLVVRHNPAAACVETSFGQIDLVELFPKLPPLANGAFPMTTPVTGSEIEAVLRGMLCDLDATLTPSDTLVSAVYKWCGRGIEAFKGIIAQWPDAVVRAKALLCFEDAPVLRFDWVLGQYTFCEMVSDVKLYKNYDSLYNHVVVLAQPEIIAAFTADANPLLEKVAD